jgi:hypothetical protein
MFVLLSLHFVTTAGFTCDRMIHTMPDGAWNIILKVQVSAPFCLIHAAMTYIRIKDEPGTTLKNRSTINISSISGLHDNVGQSHYAIRHRQMANSYSTDSRMPFHSPSFSTSASPPTKSRPQPRQQHRHR